MIRMSSAVLCVVVLLHIVHSIEVQVSYDGYSLLRITPQTDPQLQYLLRVNANTSSGLDFWLRSTAVNRSADVLVAPSAKESLLKDLRDLGITFKILIQDVGRLIREDNITPTFVPSGFEFYRKYQSADEIYAYLSQIAYNRTKGVYLKNIGYSYEGRPLLLLRITTNPYVEKPAIWIQGGAHAREQVGTATVVYIAQKLSTLCDECVSTCTLVDAFDWYILPLANPDGYEYCQNVDRLWRKTRSVNPDSPECVGVDANRNWDYKWSESSGSSGDPCSHNYAGRRAFSEPETRAVAEFILGRLRGRLELFLDFHSYSQRWLTPWGYTPAPPPNYHEQKTLAEVATAAIEKVNGTKYSVGSSGNILYTVSGGARDWAYGVAGTRYSNVVELRDLGDFGFVLPRRQILPTANETWQGLRAMALELYRRMARESIQSLAAAKEGPYYPDRRDAAKEGPYYPDGKDAAREGPYYPGLKDPAREGPNYPNRREGPYYPGLRDAVKEGPYYPGLKDAVKERPYYPDRRDPGKEGPYYPDRSNATKEGPYYPDRSHATKEEPYYPYRSHATKEGPYYPGLKDPAREGPYYPGLKDPAREGPYYSGLKDPARERPYYPDDRDAVPKEGRH